MKRTGYQESNDKQGQTESARETERREHAQADHNWTEAAH